MGYEIGLAYLSAYHEVDHLLGVIEDRLGNGNISTYGTASAYGNVSTCSILARIQPGEDSLSEASAALHASPDDMHEQAPTERPTVESYRLITQPILPTEVGSACAEDPSVGSTRVSINPLAEPSIDYSASVRRHVSSAAHPPGIVRRRSTSTFHSLLLVKREHRDNIRAMQAALKDVTATGLQP